MSNMMAGWFQLNASGGSNNGAVTRTIRQTNYLSSAFSKHAAEYFAARRMRRRLSSTSDFPYPRRIVRSAIGPEWRSNTSSSTGTNSARTAASAPKLKAYFNGQSSSRTNTRLSSYSVSLPGTLTSPENGLINLTDLAIRRLVHFYSVCSERYPMATKAAIMAMGLATGDVLSQILAGGYQHIWRTISMALFGLVFQGPAVHLLNKILDAKIMPNSPMSVKAVVTKTAIDQLMFAPVATAAFIGSMELLAGSPGTVLTAIGSRLIPTLTTSYTIWPVALLFNYAFCPPQHRIIYINAVNILWSMVLSSMTS